MTPPAGPLAVSLGDKMVPTELRAEGLEGPPPASSAETDSSDSTALEISQRENQEDSWEKVLWFDLPLSLVLEGNIGPRRFAIDSEKNTQQIGVHLQPAVMLRDGLMGRRPDAGVYRSPKIFSLGVDIAAALSVPDQGSRPLTLQEVEAEHGAYIDSIDPVVDGKRTLVSGQRLTTSSWIFSGAFYAGILWQLGGGGRIWLGPQVQGGVQGRELYLSDRAQLHSENPEAPPVAHVGPFEASVTESEIQLEKTQSRRQVRGFVGGGLQLKIGKLSGGMLLNVGCRMLLHPQGVEPMLTVGIGGNIGFAHRKRH